MATKSVCVHKESLITDKKSSRTLSAEINRLVNVKDENNIDERLITMVILE